jgi:aldose 1-epimerase
MKTTAALAAILLSLTACNKPATVTTTSGLQQETYGKMPDGTEVEIFTLTNKNGLKARVTEYGAILVSMETPDKSGKSADITHGYDTLDGWLTNTSYFGATVGRFGNRIANGKFTLDGKEYTLATNNDPGGIPCHLHGGIKGFDKVLWSGKPVGEDGVEFTYVSKDGEEGYPGNLTINVTYSLNDDNELKWEAKATTDAPTVINLVHHSYWNLSGDPTTTINDHLLTLNAPSYLPTDAGLIPTGQIGPVADTPMDFTKPIPIGERLEADFEPLKFGGPRMGPRKRRGTPPRRQTQGPEIRPRHGDIHQPTRHPVLRRKLSRWHRHRKARRQIRPPHRPLPRNRRLPGCP